MIGGVLVALAAGLLGYFVIVRQHAFAAHALAHIGFPGATGACSSARPSPLGLAVFCVGGALAIGLLGKRLADREIATGTILALATGLGVLFNSMTTRNANAVTNVLFGNLLAISDRSALDLRPVHPRPSPLVLAVVARPLVFALGQPRRGRGQGRAGAGARRGVHGGARPGHHHGGAGRGHAAAVRAGGHARPPPPSPSPPARHWSPCSAPASVIVCVLVGLVRVGHVQPAARAS